MKKKTCEKCNKEKPVSDFSYCYLHRKPRNPFTESPVEAWLNCFCNSCDKKIEEQTKMNNMRANRMSEDNIEEVIDLDWSNSEWCEDEAMSEEQTKGEVK